jgi:hypothetical protein
MVDLPTNLKALQLKQTAKSERAQKMAERESIEAAAAIE